MRKKNTSTVLNGEIKKKIDRLESSTTNIYIAQHNNAAVCINLRDLSEVLYKKIKNKPRASMYCIINAIVELVRRLANSMF